MGEDSEKNRYMYNWIALLYTWNEHNTVNQLYSSVKLKKKKINDLNIRTTTITY